MHEILLPSSAILPTAILPFCRQTHPRNNSAPNPSNMPEGLPCNAHPMAFTVEATLTRFGSSAPRHPSSLHRSSIAFDGIASILREPNCCRRYHKGLASKRVLFAGLPLCLDRFQSPVCGRRVHLTTDANVFNIFPEFLPCAEKAT